MNSGPVNVAQGTLIGQEIRSVLHLRYGSPEQVYAVLRSRHDHHHDDGQAATIRGHLRFQAIELVFPREVLADFLICACGPTAIMDCRVNDKVASAKIVEDRERRVCLRCDVHPEERIVDHGGHLIEAFVKCVPLEVESGGNRLQGIPVGSR
jgi:hypothetical protein